MDTIISGLVFFIAYIAMPGVLYFYYCRICRMPFRRAGSIVCIALFAGIFILQVQGWIPEYFHLWALVLALALYGRFFGKRSFALSLTASSLCISIYSLSSGASQSVLFGMATLLSRQNAGAVWNMDLLSSLFSLVLLTGSFHVIFQRFSGEMNELGHSGLVLLAVPVLFIALTEQTVSYSVYGNTVVWEAGRGIVAPVVSHISLLLLHIFAYIGMWSALLAYQKLVQSMQKEQALQWYQAQTREQETYVREARARYEQTRAFRHDVENHLIVLRELLAGGRAEEARSYLSELSEASLSLSLPMKTGNRSADALLGSKLMAAKQQGIQIDCELALPQNSRVTDLDWCILLSNAVDNAVAASLKIPEAERSLQIQGKKKGNLFLLRFENRCSKGTGAPVYGTGLLNIEAVAQKYHGMMKIETEDQTWRLEILLAIS